MDLNYSIPNQSAILSLSGSDSTSAGHIFEYNLEKRSSFRKKIVYPKPSISAQNQSQLVQQPNSCSQLDNFILQHPLLRHSENLEYQFSLFSQSTEEDYYFPEELLASPPVLPDYYNIRKHTNSPLVDRADYFDYPELRDFTDISLISSPSFETNLAPFDKFMGLKFSKYQNSSSLNQSSSDCRGIVDQSTEKEDELPKVVPPVVPDTSSQPTTACLPSINESIILDDNNSTEDCILITSDQSEPISQANIPKHALRDETLFGSSASMLFEFENPHDAENVHFDDYNIPTTKYQAQMSQEEALKSLDDVYEAFQILGWAKLSDRQRGFAVISM